MTTPDRTTEPLDRHKTVTALRARLEKLLADAVEESAEAKREFDAAKARHDAARKLEAAVREAWKGVQPDTPRPPDESSGESVNGELAERVREARGEPA